MSVRPNPWPQASEELLPTTFFRLADQYPDLIYAEFFTDPTNLANGYRRVTFREFANGVHAMAWWIEEHVGKPSVGDGSEAMVYFGPSDLRYGILVFASIIVGYKVRLNSGNRVCILTTMQDVISFPPLRCRSHLQINRPSRRQDPFRS
jgi:hypothetical protein